MSGIIRVAFVAPGAPGVNIYSTWRRQYLYLSGTSMAAPHVSGVAALVLAAPACGRPSAANLRDVLLNNTVPLPSLAGRTITGGRLGAERAVANCAAQQPPADFGIAVSLLSLSVRRWHPARFTVTTAVNGSTPGDVALTAAGLPNNASASFAPNPVAADTNSTITVQADRTTPKGIYALTITGTSGALSRTATVTLELR